MEKRIDLEKRGRAPDTIKEICLDNCRSPTIIGLDDSFSNLEVLSMINIGLTSLKGFPKLPKLKRLELSDNRISNGLQFLANSTELEYLNLCGNRFKELEALDPLKAFKKLEILDLFNCEVTELEGYRARVFELIPNLKYLDGYDKNNKEIEDDDDENEDDDEEDEEETNPNNGVADGDSDDNEEGEDQDQDDDDDDEEDDDDDEEGDEDDDLDEEEGGQPQVNLSYLQRDDLDEEGDEDDFHPGDEEEDDDIDEEDEDDAQQTSKGEKRKLADEGDEDAE